MLDKVIISDIFNIEKGSLQSSKNVKGEYDFITAGSEWKTHNKYSHECEALIFAMAASGSLGRTHYVNGKFIASDLCFILTPKDGLKEKLDLKFYYYYFNSIRERIVKATATGTSKLSINQTNFSNYNIVYGNINTQLTLKHVYEKVDLYSQELVLKIEKQEIYISLLRQAILQQAVEGRLVSQDENDEPAVVLLSKIKDTRLKLTSSPKEKANISEKFESKVRIESNGWIYIPAELVCDFITKGTTPKKSELLNEEEIPYLKVYNIVNNQVNFDYRPQYVSKKIHNTFLGRSKVYPNDVLTNIVGPPLGKVAIVPTQFLEWNINQALAYFRPLPQLFNKFLYYVLVEGEPIRNAVTVGTAGQDNISLAQCRGFIIPLPPLAEQIRIVKKVDVLMALCDQLEKNIAEAKKNSQKLMQAVLNKAFTSTKEESNIVKFPYVNVVEDWDIAARADGDISPETQKKIASRLAELSKAKK